MDWSSATIIVGSNDPLTNEAMQTRMPQIIIREAADSAKIKVATKIIQEKAREYKKYLEDPEYKRLLSTCQTRMDQLIEIDNANFPGMRFLENSTENMVHYVAAGILQGQPKTMDEIRNYLDIQYAQAKGRAMPGDPIPEKKPLHRFSNE